MIALHLLAALLAVCLCHQASAYYRHIAGSRGRMVRCSSASKPCRLRAELIENNPQAPTSSRVISRQVCSCPASRPCSSDWNINNDKVIVRELRTNGKINMTFSMMFCNPVEPELERWCRRDDVALRLKGMASVPTEVHSISCTCADRRPLVLHRTYRGPDFLQYNDYVCANHKRRCNVEWNPDICMVHTLANQTVLFPCKCPGSTECRSTSDDPFSNDSRCLPIEQ